LLQAAGTLSLNSWNIRLSIIDDILICYYTPHHIEIFERQVVYSTITEEAQPALPKWGRHFASTYAAAYSCAFLVAGLKSTFLTKIEFSKIDKL
jgi:hypothetical protein